MLSKCNVGRIIVNQYYFLEFFKKSFMVLSHCRCTSPIVQVCGAKYSVALPHYPFGVTHSLFKLRHNKLVMFYKKKRVRFRHLPIVPITCTRQGCIPYRNSKTSCAQIFPHFLHTHFLPVLILLVFLG